MAKNRLSEFKALAQKLDERINQWALGSSITRALEDISDKFLF